MGALKEQYLHCIYSNSDGLRPSSMASNLLAMNPRECVLHHCVNDFAFVWAFPSSIHKAHAVVTKIGIGRLHPDCSFPGSAWCKVCKVECNIVQHTKRNKVKNHWRRTSSKPYNIHCTKTNNKQTPLQFQSKKKCQWTAKGGEFEYLVSAHIEFDCQVNCQLHSPCRSEHVLFVVDGIRRSKPNMFMGQPPIPAGRGSYRCLAHCAGCKRCLLVTGHCIHRAGLGDWYGWLAIPQDPPSLQVFRISILFPWAPRLIHGMRRLIQVYDTAFTWDPFKLDLLKQVNTYSSAVPRFRKTLANCTSFSKLNSGWFSPISM